MATAAPTDLWMTPSTTTSSNRPPSGSTGCRRSTATAVPAEARQRAQKSIDARAERTRAMPLPSEVFREHMYGCFIYDPLGLKLIDDIGIDNVMIETDFPHFTSRWPHSLEQSEQSLLALDDEAHWKVLRGNAERVFQFTPAEAGATNGNGA
jgi:hypothetical protein